MRCSVLVSSAGRRVALVRLIRKNLAELGIEGQVVAVDMSDLSSAYHEADRAFQVPPCQSSDFLPRILEVARENDVRLIVPTIDTELIVYSRRCDDFTASGVTVLISRPETIEIAADKILTHHWLTEHQFPTVKQKTLGEVLQSPGEWTFPSILKPRAGSSSEGVFRVESPEQLRPLTRGTQLENWIMQEIAPGDEYTVDVLVNREGKCVCSVPRKRLQVRAGEVSKGKTYRHQPIQDLAATIAETLPGAFGPLNIQLFYDPSSETFNVVEINPRFGGGYPLTEAAGGRYIRWLLEELLGLSLTASADGWRDGCVMLRFDDAVFVKASHLQALT